MAKTSDTAGGTAQTPWRLKTPPGTSEYEAWREPDADPPALVVQVAKTQLRYHLRCIDDLQVEHNPRNNRMRARGKR